MSDSRAHTEHRITISTKWGTRKRFAAKSAIDAHDMREAFESATTPYYEGCSVVVEARQISAWSQVPEPAE